MNYCFGRVDLDTISYRPTLDWQYLTMPLHWPRCLEIYQRYCQVRGFSSVMPLLMPRLSDASSDVIGYWCDQQLVAWSLVRRFGTESVLLDQFAWDYSQPRQRVGIRSLRQECWLYQSCGFRWLYLEQADIYQPHLPELEILGAAH